MKFKKNIISSIIFLSINCFNYSSIATELETATYDGKKDIEKVLENNNAVSKDSYILNYYKERGNNGKLSFTDDYNLQKPISMSDVANLNHEYFKEGNRNLSFEDLDKLAQGKNGEEFENLRVNSVYNEAVKIGIQNALFKVLYDFRNNLTMITPEYEQIFNFNELMLAKGKVIPPVILSTGSGVTKESDLSLRKTESEIMIYTQAQVTLKAPTFFDYLNFEPIKPQQPDEILLPISDKERLLWKQGSQEGWLLGIKQGNAIINEGMASLIRDYYGMQSYHILVEQGFITMPELERLEIGTTTDGNKLNIGEVTFTVTILPAFNSNSQAWKAIPKLDDFLIKSSD